MADLLLVNANRAMAVVEVEVQQTEPINTFLEWPIRAAGPALNALPDMRIIINPLNGFADGDWFIDNFVQNATTGRISFDLSNGTAGAPADMGQFRIEVERVKK
jgi:hypothetical protein